LEERMVEGITVVVGVATGVHVNPSGQLVVVGATVGVVMYVEVLPVVKVRSLAGAVLPEAVESILK